MNPTIITARISDQRLQLVNVPLIASGGVDVIQVRFEFCGLWEGCGKTAVFYRNPKEVYHVPIADGLATVPWEVLTEEGHFYFGVFGSASNVRPTEVVKVQVAKGAITTATVDPQEPTPDIYQQLVAAYGVTEARVNNLIAPKPQVTAGGLDTFSFSSTATNFPFQVSLTSNGIGCRYSIKLGALATVGEVGRISDWYRVPLNFVPMGVVYVENDDVRVALEHGEIYADEGEAQVRVRVQYNVTTFAEKTFDTFYPVLYPTLPEVQDARVDLDGNVHGSAGDALRAVDQDLRTGTSSALRQMKEYVDGEVAELEQSISEVFDVEVIKSKNLLDLATVTPNRNLTASGAIYGQVSANYAVSAHPDFGFEYIKVKGGTTYALQAFLNGGTDLRPMRHIFAYDANKEIVGHAEDVRTYTTPENAEYVCFSFSINISTADTLPMFFEGDAVTEYEPYGDKVVTTFNAPVPAENVVGLDEVCADVAKQVVGEATAEIDERLTTLEQNGNGVVEDGFVLKYVDGCYTNNNGKATLSNSATVAEAWECVVLDVSQNVGATLGIVTYTDKAHPIFIADAGFNILGDPIAPNHGNTSSVFQTTATIPENAANLIINHYKGQPDVEVTGYMVDKYIRKDELVQELGYSEKAVMSQKAVNDAIKPHGDAIKKMAFSFRNVDAVCDRYSNEVGEVDLPKDTGTNRYIDPVNDIYALYDGLVAAYPGYVTRELMGTITPEMVQTPNTAAWQQSGEQLPALTEALPLYRYDFAPPMLLDSTTDDVSKILYCSGTHGGEIAPILQGFRFFKDLCDNWRTQDLLRALRFHCHFTVIPLVNPYGIKFSRKTNERGVNLNRNFSEQWPGVIEGDPGHGNDDDGTAASTYSGQRPASELATQRIEDMTANERFDFGLDHHTFTNFVGTAESTHGLHVGYFCSNDVGRPQDKSFADLVGTWISAKTVCNNTEVKDLSKSYCRTTAGTAFNGYLFGAFPAGYCFETIFSWGDDTMEQAYPCQKFGAEVLGGIFHTAMVSYHTY